jgi:hypothetical protein
VVTLWARVIAGMASRAAVPWSRWRRCKVLVPDREAGGDANRVPGLDLAGRFGQSAAAAAGVGPLVPRHRGFDMLRVEAASVFRGVPSVGMVAIQMAGIDP